MKRQKSILIVDDELQIGEVLIDILDPVYEEITFLNSPKNALKSLQKRKFSLIITDVHMPEMAGSEFVRTLRASGRIEPVVFLTGNATKSLILSALRLGAIDVIEKPFAADDLLKSIDRIFDMEKRKYQLYADDIKNAIRPENLESQKKMIGLLQVANDNKKNVA